MMSQWRKHIDKNTGGRRERERARERARERETDILFLSGTGV
jgi:hypothetical protein